MIQNFTKAEWEALTNAIVLQRTVWEQDGDDYNRSAGRRIAALDRASLKAGREVICGPTMSSRISTSAVKGYPGWYYSLFISWRDENDLPVYRFYCFHQPTGQQTEEIESSAYRTTTLARKMGDKKRKGYQHVAQLAIDNRPRAYDVA